MNIQGLSYSDWALYYNGAIFRNPRTGMPAYIGHIEPVYNERRDMQERDSPPKRIIVCDVGPINEDGYPTVTEHVFDTAQVQEFLSDTTLFDALPTLGYRVRKDGKVVHFISKTPGGARRGITTNKVRVANERLLSKAFYGTEYRNYDLPVESISGLAYSIFDTEYLGVEEGLAKCKAGEIVAFSPNPNVLVRPSATAGVMMEAVFRDKRVLVQYKGEDLTPEYLGRKELIEPLLKKEE
jgi:hypothetical protein